MLNCGALEYHSRPKLLLKKLYIDDWLILLTINIQKNISLLRYELQQQSFKLIFMDIDRVRKMGSQAHSPNPKKRYVH